MPALVPLTQYPRIPILAPSLSIRSEPSLSALPTLAVPAAELPAEMTAEPIEARLDRLSVESNRDRRELESAKGESSRAVAQKGFDRLLGETSHSGVPHAPLEISRILNVSGLSSAKSGAASENSAASVPSPSERKKNATRWYLTGTSLFKLGMEALSLAVPLIAMTAFGSITWAAVMAVGWVLSQALFGTLSGGLLDRHSSSKILSWSMAGQSLAVTALLGLYAVDKLLPMALGFPLFNPYLLLVFYSLAGGFMGASDTARQVIAAEVVGDNEKAVKVFNAKTHAAYEVSGVVGALGAGVAIKAFGLISALLIHPPAYLLAALAFSRMNLPMKSHAVEAKSGDAKGGLISGVRRYFKDLRLGFRTVWSHPTYKWGMLALVAPLAIHRLLEGLLIPVFAKGVLQDPSSAAWIVGTSNFGELIGAILLAKILMAPGSNARSGFWVRLMAVGLLGLWAMSFTQELIILLPLIAFGSLSWAASDLSLRGKLQNSLPDALRGRAFGFIGAVGYVTILLASLGLGRLMDAWGGGPVILAVNIAVTALALLLFKAGKVLTHAPKPEKDDKGG